MQEIKITFRLSMPAGHWRAKTGEVVCVHTLSEYFHIPPNTKEIDIVLSKKPKPNSFKVVVLNEGHWIQVTGVERSYTHWLLWCTFPRLQAFGAPCYVSVEA